MKFLRLSMMKEILKKSEKKNLNSSHHQAILTTKYLRAKWRIEEEFAS